MKKFIPEEKLGKKARRELNRAKRGGWGGINPVTRKPPNPRSYNRKKACSRPDESEYDTSSEPGDRTNSRLFPMVI